MRRMFSSSVTFVKDGDMYSSQQRLVVPARDKMLNLEVISNKNEYKPRETASYTILARDADGAPVPDAEVSLGVVDEAIYSVSPDYLRQHPPAVLRNALQLRRNSPVSLLFLQRVCRSKARRSCEHQTFLPVG